MTARPTATEFHADLVAKALEAFDACVDDIHATGADEMRAMFAERARERMAQSASVYALETETLSHADVLSYAAWIGYCSANVVRGPGYDVDELSGVVHRCLSANPLDARTIAWGRNVRTAPWGVSVSPPVDTRHALPDRGEVDEPAIGDAFSVAFARADTDRSPSRDVNGGAR